MLDALYATLDYPITIALVVAAGVLLARLDVGVTMGRLQQGLRPKGYGDVWDAMPPKERRGAFIGDIVVCSVGILAIFWIWTIVEAYYA